MKTTKMILVLFVCILCTGILVADPNVTGKWELTMTTPRGERTFSVEFTQEGEALAVVARGREGRTAEAKGSVKGSDIDWTMHRETPRGTVEIAYEGKIEGDSMKGTVQFGTRGSGEWSAKRLDD
jgi:hypothetical protein